METERLKTCTCTARGSVTFGITNARLRVKMALAMLVTILLFPDTNCFNLDIRTNVVHSGPPSSKFGFSVALHSGVSEHWLLVGAPLANTTQKEVIEGGAVYKCGTNRNSVCTIIQMDTTGNNFKINGRNEKVPLEEKSGQWFGATVVSSGPTGTVVACAPRYIYFSMTLNKREPVGACYITIDNFASHREYSPCRSGIDSSDVLDQYHRQGFCGFGFSAVIPKPKYGNWVSVGAPGSFYWQGQLFTRDVKSGSGLAAHDTNEGPQTDDDSYMGYAVASGEFDGDNQPDFVAGAPKALLSKGKVLIWSRFLSSIHNISGKQMGSHFGSSLAVVDLNGDGLDDIVVGAPLHTDFETTLIETGRVFVYYQTKQNGFSDSVMLKGYNDVSGARFGFSLAAIDDLNQDGFKDLAVGAPYDGPDGAGAVYIFHGSGKGINQEFSQVIYGKNVSNTMKSFGYSISGGYDLDGNAYPDLLVGAQEADQAVLLKSRPIVTVVVDMKVNPSFVKLNRKNCQLDDGTNVTCLNINTCFKYSAIQKPEEIRMDIQWKLDSQQVLNGRVFLLKNPQSNIEIAKNQALRKGQKHCRTLQAYVKNDLRDKLSPLVVDFSFKLITNESNYGPEELIPILNQNRPTTDVAHAQIWKDCGHDNVCIPDLRVSAQSLTAFHRLGSKDDIIISVDVTNLEDGAFESLILITLPPGVKYINVFDVDSPTLVSCNRYSEDVSCDIGNPIPGGGAVKFKILLKPESVNGTSDYLRFFLQANSSNPENQTTVFNNRKEVAVPLKVVTNFKISGVSQPEQVEYSSNDTGAILTESDIGPQVIHLYEVLNDGPSTVGDAEVNILWPSQSNNDQHMLYLPEGAKVIQGNGFCITRYINPDNITVESPPIEVDGVVPISGSLTRNKRAVKYNKDVKKMECGNDWCETIKCFISNLKAGDNALIQIRARVWSRTLVQAKYRDLVLSSKATATVISVPYAVKMGKTIEKSFQIDTLLHSDSIPEIKPLAWWWILIAVAGGLLLLILLVVILWRCGFFRRKRVPDEDGLIDDERETMQVERKHNGAYDDDEV